jgi:hypothetical protein
VTKDYWKSKKKVHEWDYMGHDKETKVEYSMCIYCKKFRADGKYITDAYYNQRVKLGVVEGM